MIFIMLAASLLPAGNPTYRLEYQICGSVVSRLLLFIPLHVYYEASAAIDLTALPQPNGATCFIYKGIPRPAYILRTLGFSGKSLALLTASEEGDGNNFVDKILMQWRNQAPEFAGRLKTVIKFPHRLIITGPEAFAFERDSHGYYKNFTVGLEPRYRYHPAKTGFYFKVFPTLVELLKLLNHRFTPPQAAAPFSPFPAEWTGDMLDFSDNLNRVVALLEKAVESLVTVKQKNPFRLNFRVSDSTAEWIEICGQSFPDVPLWKGIMIKEVFHRVRLQLADRMLLSDEFWMGIRNSKGQGGFGRLQLKMIDSGENMLAARTY